MSARKFIMLLVLNACGVVAASADTVTGVVTELRPATTVTVLVGGVNVSKEVIAFSLDVAGPNTMGCTVLPALSQYYYLLDAAKMDMAFATLLTSKVSKIPITVITTQCGAQATYKSPNFSASTVYFK